MAKGTVTIEYAQSLGTYTLRVKREGETIQLRAGITTLAEARSRAGVWHACLGYTVREKAFG